MSAPPPYVGVAGVTTRKQANAVLAAIPSGFPRRVAIGVLASAKTLAGGDCNARSPAPGDIAAIFPNDVRALNLVHYFTRTIGEGLSHELAHALSVGGSNCNGLQINVAWPEVRQLRSFLDGLSRTPRVVLQIGPAALDVVNHDPQRTADILSHYVDGGVISDVLLDGSGGTGRPIGFARIADFAAVLRAAYPDLGIAIAGGLSPHHLPDRALLRGVSIDAESGVRDASDALDNGKVRAFLANVGGLLGEAEST